MKFITFYIQQSPNKVQSLNILDFGLWTLCIYSKNKVQSPNIGLTKKKFWLKTYTKSSKIFQTLDFVSPIDALKTKSKVQSLNKL